MTEPSTLPPFKVLFVSEIDNRFEEDSLWQVFAPWATKIRSICVNRSGELRSRKSASAYVNFYDHQAAQDALKKVQPLFLGPSFCRVFPYDGDLYRKPPRPEHYNGCGLFVRNLDLNVSIKQVYDFFCPFGPLQTCRIATDDNGVSRGFAYVTYESTDVAQSALRETDEKLLGSRVIAVTENRPRAVKGHRLFVRFSQSAKSAPGAETEPELDSEANDGFRQNSSESETSELGVTEDDLLRVFKPFPSFDKLAFLHNTRPSTHRHGSRGYAFVTLLDLSEAEQAIATIKEIAGFPATVRFATSDQPSNFVRRPRPGAPVYERIGSSDDLTSPHLASPHLASPHLASPHLASPQLASPHLASPHLASPHLASPHLTSPHLTSPQLAGDMVAKLTLSSPPVNGHDSRFREESFDRETEYKNERRTISETNLFVRPIPPQITESDLSQRFSPYGTLLSVRIMTDTNGESRGFGFVGYESSESAARAAAELDGTELGRSTIQVSPAYSRRNAPRRNSARPHLYGASPLPLSLANSSVTMPGYYYVPVDFLPLDYAYRISAGPSSELAPAGVVPLNNYGSPGSYGPTGYPYTVAYPKSYSSGGASVSPPPTASPPAGGPEASVWSVEEQALGEKLHPFVLRHPRIGYEMKLANIVTGMLLRQPLECVTEWLRQPVALDQVIGQAVDAYVESTQ